MDSREGRDAVVTVPRASAGPVVVLCRSAAAVPLADLLQRHPRSLVVVVVIGSEPSQRRGPGASPRVRVRHVAHPGRVIDVLRVHDPPAVIIDLCTGVKLKRAALERYLPHLEEGGLYVVEGVADADDIAGTAARRGPSRAPALRAGWAWADVDRVLNRHRGQGVVADVTRVGTAVLVRVRGRRYLKLRDRDVADVLGARVGPGWGGVLVARPRTTFTSRATVHANRPDLLHRYRPEMVVQERYLREHYDVVCHRRQMALQGTTVLPISFHHPNRRQLHNRRTSRVSDDVATIPSDVVDDHLAGRWFHLDSEFPGHFGHFMTEDLSRLWGWRVAKRLHPDMRMLISTGQPGADLKPFQRTLLEAAGVAPEDVVVFHDPVRVEVLVGASPLFHNRRFVDPEVAEVWGDIADVLAPRGGPGPDRVFLTRPEGLARRCTNGAEVEARFAAHGFAVVDPESRSLPDQVALFAGARVVAGYAGSAMFGMVYSRTPGTRIVIGSSQYTASNEYLIASVKGDVLHQYWCDAEVDHPSGGWSVEAFHADFRFDFDADGASLEAVLGGLDGAG